MGGYPVMKKFYITSILIAALLAASLNTSCSGSEWDGFYWAVAGLVLVGVGVGVLLAGDEDSGNAFVPADPLDLPASPEKSTIIGDFKTPSEADWYSISLDRPGEVVTVWADSPEGTVAYIVTEDGSIFRSENGYEPETNFRIAIHAMQKSRVHLMVLGISPNP